VYEQRTLSKNGVMSFVVKMGHCVRLYFPVTTYTTQKGERTTKQQMEGRTTSGTPNVNPTEFSPLFITAAEMERRQSGIPNVNLTDFSPLFITAAEMERRQSNSLVNPHGVIGELREVADTIRTLNPDTDAGRYMEAQQRLEQIMEMVELTSIEDMQRIEHDGAM